MTAYYNEIDKYAAQWLRNLITAGHIAPGIVDERSIEDVYPSDLRGFTQCHFFAGIGVWSHALRDAGWSDDRPVWTGSCPCQPFSAAGQGAGFADERHLWPAFHHLIKECRPAAVLGEQVASKDSDPWIDLVHTDLEALGYAFGAIPFPAAGVGAPHIRDRLYWVADAQQHYRGPQATAANHWESKANRPANRPGGRGSVPSWLGHAYSVGTGRDWRPVSGQVAGQDGQHIPLDAHASGGDGGMADATRGQHVTGSTWADQRSMASGDGAVQAAPGATGTTNGYWADADWLFCRDGRWRPVEPGSFPLVNGAPSRVGRLRAYGNAICAKAAQVFIECVMDCAP